MDLKIKGHEITNSIPTNYKALKFLPLIVVASCYEQLKQRGAQDISMAPAGGGLQDVGHKGVTIRCGDFSLCTLIHSLRDSSYAP